MLIFDYVLSCIFQSCLVLMDNNHNKSDYNNNKYVMDNLDINPISNDNTNDNMEYTNNDNDNNNNDNNNNNNNNNNNSNNKNDSNNVKVAHNLFDKVSNKNHSLRMTSFF